MRDDTLPSESLASTWSASDCEAGLERSTKSSNDCDVTHTVSISSDSRLSSSDDTDRRSDGVRVSVACVSNVPCLQ